jgi:hypothetical protein
MQCCHWQALRPLTRQELELRVQRSLAKRAAEAEQSAAQCDKAPGGSADVQTDRHASAALPMFAGGALRNSRKHSVLGSGAVEGLRRSR